MSMTPHIKSEDEVVLGDGSVGLGKTEISLFMC